MVTKSLPSGVPEAGIHVHMLERELGRTKVDGAHFHVFRLPDGSFIQTMEDGRHGHPIEGDGPHEWIHDGAHAHRIPLTDGSSLITELDGYHNHQSQTDSTAFDGVHTHKLMLPDGATIESLLPFQHHVLEGSPPQQGNPDAPPASELAKVAKMRGPIPADAFLTKDGRLEIHFADRVISVAITRGDIEITADDDYDPAGSSRFTALEGVQASIRFNPEKKAEGFLFSSGGTVEVGLLAEDQQEYFLRLPTKDGEISGTLKMVKRDGIWYATLARDVPNVFRAGAAMPSPGCSAIPASLEADVPETVRYWKIKDQEQARKARDWLVETEFFTKDADVRLVGGSLRKVVVERRYFAYEPEDVAESDWPTEIARLLPEDVDVVSPFAVDDWQAAIKAHSAEALMVLDPPSTVTLSPQALCELAKNSPFLLGSEDTPAARAAFAKAGRPFKLRDAAVHDRLFVASFPIVAKTVAFVETTSDGFKWTGQGCDVCGFGTMEASEIAKFDPKKPCPECGVTMAVSKDAAFKRVLDRLNKVRIIRADDMEERFVYGIAMEPGEVDTQGDTQTADTIRTAAHKFMEDFGNVGLQHTKFVNGKVKILESAIMPFGGELAGVIIKVGTWMFGVRVLDDGIWKSVKEGDLTGFSIGGVANREPV